MLSTVSTGNCNFTYISNLRGTSPEKAILDLFATMGSPFRKTSLVYRNPSYAILLFAQGSEDPVDKNPYAPKLAAFIKKYKLGEVWSSGEAVNILHKNKPGILYMWKIDRDALKRFVTTHYTGAKFTPPKRVVRKKVADVNS